MKEIKTFEELENIENEKYSLACSLDLMLLRIGHHIIDGIVLLIGPNCKENLEMYYISQKRINTWKEKECQLIHRRYGVRVFQINYQNKK